MLRNSVLCAVAVRFAFVVTAAVAATDHFPSDTTSGYVDVRDFGAKGSAFVRSLIAEAPAGTHRLTVQTPDGLASGMRIQADGIPAGSTISEISGRDVTFSSSAGQGLTRPLHPTDLVDFVPDDDTDAFRAAYKTACEHNETVIVPAGRYYISGNVTACAVPTLLLGATQTTGSSGFPNVTDQSQIMGGVGAGLSYRFTAARGEEAAVIFGDFESSGGRQDYQKNAESIRITNNDRYQKWIDAEGASHTASHDAVGQFILAQQPSTNNFGHTWAWNHVLQIDDGSNGSSVIGEAQIINMRSYDGDDFDGGNTVAGYDEIYNCKHECLYAHYFQGGLNGHYGLLDGLVFRHGTVHNIILGQLTPGERDADLRVSAAQHLTDFALYANGLAFFQSLHIGGGPAKGDQVPEAGLTVESSGALSAPSIAAPVARFPGVSIGPEDSGTLTLGSDHGDLAPRIVFRGGKQGDCTLAGEQGKLAVACSGATTEVHDGSGTRFLAPVRSVAPLPVSSNDDRLATTAWTNMAIAHGAHITARRFMELPATPADWSDYVCTDCRINGGVAGVRVMWNPQIRRWTGLSGESVTHLRP